MKSLLSFILLFINVQAIACPNLLGTWQSSKELSMKYTLSNPGFSEKNIDFKKQVFGILKVTYHESTIHTHGAPTKRIIIADKEYDFHFEDLEFNYEVITCTKDSIKIKEYYPNTDPIIVKIHFVDRNTIWVSGPGFNENEREYFVRIKK